MSTLVTGDVAAVFAALRHAFDAAAEHGGTVMVATVSNACPPHRSWKEKAA
jgi:microcompartment protein CcmL/EutN